MCFLSAASEAQVFKARNGSETQSEDRTVRVQRLTMLLIDGEVYFMWKFSRSVTPSDSVYVSLWGRSLNSKILHGPVRVYRGLRYVN